VILRAAGTAEAVDEVAERFRRAFEEHAWRRHPELVPRRELRRRRHRVAALEPSGAPADLLARADAAL
jgi:hypothetical protein